MEMLGGWQLEKSWQPCTFPHTLLLSIQLLKCLLSSVSHSGKPLSGWERTQFMAGCSEVWMAKDSRLKWGPEPHNLGTELIDP